MIDFPQFKANCNALRERVARAAAKCGRPADSVKILPVTKTHPLDAAEFSAEYSFLAVGENKVQ